MRRFGASIGVAATLLLSPATGFAANKEQQLLMAELRIMQQQQQQLQQMVVTLADGLKAVTGRLDEQAANSRKALADQRLLIENMTDTVRVLRERSDDTNVRLSSITQELESIRQTIASQPQAPASTVPAGDPAADPGTNPNPGAPPTTPPGGTLSTAPPGISAQRAYDSAYSDYAAGQYSIAIDGFETFLRLFPRHLNADDAQLNIGNARYNAGEYREAVAAYQRVISDYPKTETVPQAYFKMGLSYIGLKQPDLAKKAFETVLQNYPSSPEATLAKQRLEGLNKGN
jgi:tol-pal system protein YbgF